MNLTASNQLESILRPAAEVADGLARITAPVAAIAAEVLEVLEGAIGAPVAEALDADGLDLPDRLRRDIGTIR